MSSHKAAHKENCFACCIDRKPGNADIKNIYLEAVEQIKEKREEHPSGFAKVWEALSPTGNIYRFNGLAAERRKHCADLQKQLRELAEDHRAILGGEQASPEQLEHALLQALKETPVQDMLDPENGHLSKHGHLPLEEFLDFKVSTFCCFFTLPANPEVRWFRLKAMVVAHIIFLVQILAPFLIVLDNWEKESNYLRDPKALWTGFTLEEALCLGGDPASVANTIMGTAMLFLVYIYVYSYADAEAENAGKMQRLPLDSYWAAIGVFANSWCIVFTTLGMPLRFWADGHPSEIVLDALALVFIFALDDLSGDICGFLGVDDEGFQKLTMKMYAFLSHCPVCLADCINKDATKKEDLWKITIDKNSNLLGAKGQICKTRLSVLEGNEKMPLLQADDDENLASLIYYTDSAAQPTTMPGLGLPGLLWKLVGLFVFFSMAVLPSIYFVMNKECKGGIGDDD